MLLAIAVVAALVGTAPVSVMACCETNINANGWGRGDGKRYRNGKLKS